MKVNFILVFMLISKFAVLWVQKIHTWSFRSQGIVEKRTDEKFEICAKVKYNRCP